MPPHGEGALLGLVVVALGAVVVGCTCAWLRSDGDPDVSPLQARARRGPDGGHIGSNVRQEAAQRKRARRAERNLQIAGRRSSRHLEPGQPPTARWWRRTASRRR